MSATFVGVVIEVGGSAPSVTIEVSGDAARLAARLLYQSVTVVATADVAVESEAGEWTTLAELPCGAIFETRDGIRAVKSEYCYSNAGAIQCVLLASGEYAHFAQSPAGRGSAEQHNATAVRELVLR